MALKMDCAREDFHAWNPNTTQFRSISCGDLTRFDANRRKSLRKRCRTIIARAKRAGSVSPKTTPNVVVGFFRHTRSVTWLARSRLVHETGLDYSTGHS